VLIMVGQSLRESQTPTTYVPTNASAIDNFNIFDGAIYPYQEPLLGCSYTGTTPGFGTGHLGGRIADKFITGGQFDRVILVTIAIGGSDIAAWATGYASDRIAKTLARLASRGIVAQTNVTIAIEMGIGESDNQGGTSQAVFTSRLNTVIANAQAAGFTGRFFVAQETWYAGVTSAAVAAAQAAAPNGTTVFASGNIDSLNNASRIDGTHLNDAGAAAAATLIYNAMHASGAPF
jgi:lysophospholipase L1-like esterase